MLSGVDFPSALEDKVTQLLQAEVGQSVDPLNYVKTWWNTVKDFDINTDVPIIVVTARNANQTSPGEMGTARELWQWILHIYYIDVEQVDFDAGRHRRGNITTRIRNALENTPRLDGLSVLTNPNNPTGAIYEFVYDSNFTSTVYDSSGQEGYYAFTTELYLTVNTARNNSGLSIGP